MNCGKGFAADETDSFGTYDSMMGKAYVDWSENGSVPTREGDVIGIFQSIADGTITDTMFTTLEFFQQAEVAWD